MPEREMLLKGYESKEKQDEDQSALRLLSMDSMSLQGAARRRPNTVLRLTEGSIENKEAEK